ncbi:protein adenylyltransferase SelO [Neptuniibacter sp. CAU 1671]|uniref:protein adenylyltransferase SelO n=1 Tax=Neptuniibacter sp. CAU 1671 TaxID=3032593 RepID=UPI0023DA5F72|nr:YdiU family protein [Neptuniibacter sp. CAU 1671]MDF2182204.1 YdiU family protein [Neptuniibacter sp. CAU 1671]
MILTNSYLSLGDEFYQQIEPTPVAAPNLLLWNHELADQLAIDPALQQDRVALSQYFSGNRLFPDSTPVALAYAGHQFGQFNPRLGDGRAHLLGELTDRTNHRFDIQLKGSGPTRFSRSGDGRCAMGPAVREFIMSEAMHALGIPTARSLAVVTTGEMVFREEMRPGAVVTRIAASHLRVGTFEYFASQGNLDAVERLCGYAVERHYPELKQETGEGFYTAFLQAVCRKQIELICHWLRVGFIHGVMNTDNTSISGETIDYGPCAMMSSYNPDAMFSSIDHSGRYRFIQQPQICQWNMARLAESLLPLIHEDSKTAVSIAEELLKEMANEFHQQYFAMLGKKIGLTETKPADETLINDLLKHLRLNKLDYTQTFHRLTESLHSSEIDTQISTDLGDWYPRWKIRLDEQGENKETVYQQMRSQNPVVIPRNHHMEAVIRSCIETGSADDAEAFLAVLKSPYRETATTAQYQDAPADNDRDYQTFCGT